MSEIKVGQFYKSERGTIIKIIKAAYGSSNALVKFITLNPSDKEEMYVNPAEDMLSSPAFRVIGGCVDFELIENSLYVGAEVFENDNPPIAREEKGIVIAINDKECVVDYGKDGSGYVVYDSNHFDKLKPYPLCWIEDVPIYNGMTLYYKDDGEECIVRGYIERDGGCGDGLQVKTKSYGVCGENLCNLTTIAPKKPVKIVKWVNVYGNDKEVWTSRLYDSCEDAYNKRSKQNYVATSSIEWEQ